MVKQLAQDHYITSMPFPMLRFYGFIFVYIKQHRELDMGGHGLTASR